MNITRGVVIAFMVFLFTRSSLAVVHTVGDAAGWSVGADYTTWAATKTFAIGDTLVFSYGGGHTVEEVSQSDYMSCTIGNSLSSDSSGSTSISLLTSGPHYFICGMMGHCDNGMKLLVNVGGGNTNDTSALPPPSSILTPPSATTTTPPMATDPVSSSSNDTESSTPIGMEPTIPALNNDTRSTTTIPTRSSSSSITPTPTEAAIPNTDDSGASDSDADTHSSSSNLEGQTMVALFTGMALFYLFHF